ncbi:MAG: nucleotidyltransferase family protein [Isosphaeraceae bacterium]
MNVPRGSFKIAAIIPAAGRSERMGRPKLILPIEGETVVSRVVSAFLKAGVDPVIVVAPPSEIEGAGRIAEEARARGAFVIVPNGPTADMRASIEFGLLALIREFAPPEAVLIAPADSPGLSSNVIGQVMDRYKISDSIVTPIRDGKRGHPLLLPWEIALEIFDLPPDVGVNTLLSLRADRVSELPIDDPGAFEDMDTPEDYRKWSEGDS